MVLSPLQEPRARASARFARLRVVAAAVALAAGVGNLSAHGGQYRGPVPPMPPGVPIPPVGGPAAPAPGVPTAGATTGVTVGPSEPVSWQIWWEFNKDPFLEQRALVAHSPVTGSDDFYLGKRRSEIVVDTMLPTAIDRAERIVPALARLLENESSRDVQTACLRALGMGGRHGPGLQLETTLASFLRRDDQEVRETAVLALGIAGRPKALPILAALLTDDAEGRRLVDREEVTDRTRAFAAYALGCLAQRSDDLALEQRVHDLLWAVLQDRDEKHRDLRVAAVNGLGILGLDGERGAQKRLLWQTVEDLLGWWQRDLGRGDELVQAQAPIAIARLLGRGDSPLHRRCKEQFAAVVSGKLRRSNQIQQSAAIALGALVLPPEVHADDARFVQDLQRCYEKGVDRLARYFAVIALGRIGGPAVRTWLQQAYTRSSKATERPWCALALGLQAAAGAARGEVDETTAQMLLDDLQTLTNREVCGAIAVALGLTGSTRSAPAVVRLLRDNESEEVLAGYLCVSLALLGDQASAATLHAILARSLRRPFLVLQAAVALGRLGDREAPQRLMELMKKNDSLAVLSALAVGIGQIGDRRSIEPLIAMSQDAGLTKLARAFVAAALGGVGDKDPMPWNVPLSVDCNYDSAVDTLTNGATGILDIL
jgi:HEAT repeat protein